MVAQVLVVLVAVVAGERGVMGGEEGHRRGWGGLVMGHLLVVVS